MRRRLGTLALMGLLTVAATGCVGRVVRGPLADFTIQDLRSAEAIATAAKDLLPPDDPWGPCVGALATTIEQLQATAGLETDGRGVFTEAMRLHVLESVVRAPATPAKVSCGGVVFQILLRGATRLPGF